MPCHATPCPSSRPVTTHACYRPSTDSMFSGMLEASAEAAEEWLMNKFFEEQLFCFFPCTEITPALANKVCL